MLLPGKHVRIMSVIIAFICMAVTPGINAQNFQKNVNEEIISHTYQTPNQKGMTDVICDLLIITPNEFDHYVWNY